VSVASEAYNPGSAVTYRIRPIDIINHYLTTQFIFLTESYRLIFGTYASCELRIKQTITLRPQLSETEASQTQPNSSYPELSIFAVRHLIAQDVKKARETDTRGDMG
jgi:hypothetical protein